MSYSNPRTLVANTPENVGDVQSNFDAVESAFNGFLGDVTGTFDNLAVNKVTKQQLRVGAGGNVESTAVTSVVMRSNYDPASGKLIDTSQTSWMFDVGGSDQVVISRAAATSGTPSYSAVVTITSSGISGITTTVGDGTITSAKLADGTIKNVDVASDAAIAESKLNLASDASAGTASRRTLGSASTQAAAGNHTHTISGVTGLQTALDAKASTASVNSSLALKANKADPTFTGGITLTSGPTDLGGTLTADGVAQFNNGLNVDGAGTTLDGGTFKVQPLSAGGGWTDSDAARFKVTSTGIGFHGNTPVTRRTITGARDESDATGALENLLNYFDDIGLIHDSTTAHH